MDKAYDDTSLRLVGGTYFNLILRSKKIKLDNGRVPSESEIFAGLLNVFGADVDIKDSKGYSPLAIAVENNNLEICRKLIRNNAAVDSKAIDIAKKMNNKEIKKLLGLEYIN